MLDPIMLLNFFLRFEISQETPLYEFPEFFAVRNVHIVWELYLGAVLEFDD